MTVPNQFATVAGTNWLWVSRHGVDSEQREQGFVENGWWDGLFYDGRVLIIRSGLEVPAVIVWRGRVPAPYDDDCETALAWIKAEIAAGRTGL